MLIVAASVENPKFSVPTKDALTNSVEDFISKYVMKRETVDYLSKHGLFEHYLKLADVEHLPSNPKNGTLNGVKSANPVKK